MMVEGIFVAVVSGLILDGIRSNKSLKTIEEIRQYLEYTTDRADIRDEIYREILKKVDVNEKSLNQIYKSIQEDSHFAELISQNIKYKTNFAMRLDYVMTLINAHSDSYEKVNLEILAEHLGFDSVNVLKEYYKNDKEPTFSFISDIAGKLGVNKEWFKNGNEKPFRAEIKLHYAANFIDKVIELKPENIIFCLSDESHMRIALKVDRFRYLYGDRSWHFNNNVGAGGQSQIESIYKFIKYLRKEDMLHRCTVSYLANDLFDKIFCGEIPASSALSDGKRKFSSKVWLEDFISLKNNDYYGEHFNYCQNVVKYRLKLKEQIENKV